MNSAQLNLTLSLKGNTMADIFRRMLDFKTGKGGVHCQCCNSYRGKEKSILRRIVRRIIKHKDNTALEPTKEGRAKTKD